MTDFESAFIAAIKLKYPHIKHWGCHFHFCQCLYRKIQNLSLATEYENKNCHIHKWLRLFTVIPFLPPNKVDEGLNYIISITPVYKDNDMVRNF